MKANELRIGNYVKPKNGYSQSIRVKYIAQDGEIYSNSDMGQCEYAYTVSQVLPIPLTDEWLERFGAVNLGTDWNPQRVTYKINRIHFYFHPVSGYGLNHTGLDWHEIKFVHQLQNLYFALTGEELEIKSNNKSSNVPE